MFISVAFMFILCVDCILCLTLDVPYIFYTDLICFTSEILVWLIFLEPVLYVFYVALKGAPFYFMFTESFHII